MKNRIKYLLHSEWREIYEKFIGCCSCENGYNEAINFSYSFSPVYSYRMSAYKSIFKYSKAKAIYCWYKNADSKDKSILQHFKEYSHCIDEQHQEFNSNYGIYAYNENGLQLCIERLLKDKNTRQAMFCINNNSAMSDNSIDKLCTNAIQFFMRNNKLQMVVHMRSSNFFTLLPYDAFMFTVFYLQVYWDLRNTYTNLEFGEIHVNAATLHFYDSDVEAICTQSHDIYSRLDLIHAQWSDWQNDLEQTFIGI